MDIKQVGTKDTHTHTWTLNIATQIRLGNKAAIIKNDISQSGIIMKDNRNYFYCSPKRPGEKSTGVCVCVCMGGVWEDCTVQLGQPGIKYEFGWGSVTLDWRQAARVKITVALKQTLQMWRFHIRSIKEYFNKKKSQSPVGKQAKIGKITFSFLQSYRADD